jgi:hypothetical protein
MTLNEIETLPESFSAAITAEKLQHRGIDAGLIAAFVGKVEEHHARYGVKIRNLRELGGDAAALDTVQHAINSMAVAAIDHAKFAGRVSVDHQ